LGRGATRNKLHHTDYALAKPYGGSAGGIVWQLMTTRPPTNLRVPKVGIELGENGSIFPRPKAKC